MGLRSKQAFSCSIPWNNYCCFYYPTQSNLLRMVMIFITFMYTDNLKLRTGSITNESFFFNFRRMNTRWAFSTWEFVMMADVKFTPTNLQWIYFSMVCLPFLLVLCCDFSVIVYPKLIPILKVTKNTFNILKCIWRQSRLQIAFHFVHFDET